MQHSRVRNALINTAAGCSQALHTSCTAAIIGIFSRSFCVMATRTVITFAAGPVILTLTIGPSMPSHISSPPPVPTRYGLISSRVVSTFSFVSSSPLTSSRICTSSDESRMPNQGCRIKEEATHSSEQGKQTRAIFLRAEFGVFSATNGHHPEIFEDTILFNFRKLNARQGDIGEEKLFPARRKHQAAAWSRTCPASDLAGGGRCHGISRQVTKRCTDPSHISAYILANCWDNFHGR